MYAHHDLLSAKIGQLSLISMQNARKMCSVTIKKSHQNRKYINTKRFVQKKFNSFANFYMYIKLSISENHKINCSTVQLIS